MAKQILLILLTSAALLASKTIDSIHINGFDGAKLKPIIHIKVGDKYQASKVEQAKRIIKQALGSVGYKHPKVKSSISNKGSTVGIRFDIQKGNKLTITKIKFVGNKHISDKDLSNKLVNQEAEFMGWFPGRSDGTVNIPQLKYDALRVQDEYLKKGYLDVKINTPIIKIDSKTSNATIIYNIKEGKQYKVSKVDLSIYKPKKIDKKVIQGQLSLKPNDIFDVSKLRNDIKNIVIKLGDLGYAYAKVMPTFMKNDKKYTLAVWYKVIPGTKYKINNVTINGNTKTKDWVIRKYISFVPGNFYNHDKLEESRKALSKTGFFENVIIKPKKISANKLDMKIDLKEGKTRSFILGGGYGSIDGWMVNGSIGSRNIFGTGIETKASVDYSKVTQSYSLSLKEPRLFDSKYSILTKIYKNNNNYSKSDSYNNLAYDKKNDIGAYFIFGRQFTSAIHASMGYGYRDVEYQDINTSAEGFDQGRYDPYIKSSILGNLVYDSTDDYFTPRDGIYAKFGIEYAGLGNISTEKRSAEFVRYDTKLAIFYGLKDQINYDLILRAKFRGSYIDHDKGKYVPIAERLYLGGASRGVRGFKSGTISPVDSNGYRIGAYKSYALSIEASIPLSEKSKMRMTLFADYGQIGENSFDITQKSIGAQVEWRSPFGPINLIFAKAIEPDDVHGDTSSFEFNIGGKF